MRRLLVPFVAIVLAGCWDIGSERCGELYCPSGTTCFAAEGECVDPGELCDDPDDTPCLLGQANENQGLCIAGRCRAYQCKAGTIAGREPTLDPGEECEVGITASCLDAGFDRGRAGCDDQCRDEFSSCERIGWQSEKLFVDVDLASWRVASTDDFTIAAALSASGGFQIFRRDAGDSFFVQIDALPGLAGGLARDGDGVIAAGAFGDFIARFDGQTWSEESVPGAWQAVASAGDTAWAVGNLGALAHRAKGLWEVYPSTPFSESLRDVWLADEENGVAVGVNTIGRLTDGVWTNIVFSPPLDVTLTAVIGRSMADVYVAGNDGYLAHLEGTVLTELVPQQLAGLDLEDLAILADELLVAGADGMLSRWDGSALHRIAPSSEKVTALDTAAGVLIAGSGGSIHQYQGASWATHEAPPSGDFRDLFANHSGDLWLARGKPPFGAPLPLSRFVATKFDDDEIDSQSPPVIRAVWASGNRVVAAAGATLHERIDLDNWVEILTASNPINDIAGDGTRTYVVGDGGMVHQVETDTAVLLGTAANINAAHSGPGLPLFVVGDGGFFAQIDNNRSTTIATGTSSNLRGVFSASATDVYLVGDDSTLLHFDGTSVSRQTLPTLGGMPLLVQSLRAIHGTSAADIFAVGERGLIVHFDGVGWSQIRSPSPALTTVFALPTVVTFAGPINELHQLVRPAP